MFSLANIPELVLSVLAVLITLSLHEFAHAFAAYKLGDNTARNLGRLSLNPLKHLDPIGAIFMLVFHFGWAKPVPINARNFKKPKRDFAITALAGPLSNVIVAFFSTFLYLISLKVYLTGIEGFLGNVVYNTCLFLSVFSSINVGLGIFNLIPIPPFDGSRILNVILPAKLYFKVMKYERYIYWGVIAWLFLGSYVYSTLVAIPFIGSNAILSTVLRVFDLSGLIHEAIVFIYRSMVSFWQLLPFLR